MEWDAAIKSANGNKPENRMFLMYTAKMWPTTQKHYDPSIVAENEKLIQKHELSITFLGSLFIQRI